MKRIRYRNRVIGYKRRHEQHRRKKIVPYIKEYRDNPVGFCEDFLGINLFEYQKTMLKGMAKYKANKIPVS